MAPGKLAVSCLFDEESGKGTEDKRLDTAAKPVKVQTGNGGDTYRQPGEAFENAAQAREDCKNSQDPKDNAQDEGELLIFLLAQNNQHAAKNQNQACHPKVGAKSCQQTVAGGGQCSVDESVDDRAGVNALPLSAWPAVTSATFSPARLLTP